MLERYELMYEVGLIDEAHRDGSVESGLRPIESTAMALDHRRIVATALARMRGKLSYRPVVFEMLPEAFTLRHLKALLKHCRDRSSIPRTFGGWSTVAGWSKEQGS